MKYFKYKIKNDDNLIDIESKIADIIFKIFTVFFIGFLGTTISIYNLKLNNEKTIYELLTTTTKQIEESRNLSMERHLEPIFFALEMSGRAFSKNSLLEYLSSNDLQYQQINKNFLETTNQFKANINEKFENNNIASYMSIATIVFSFLIYAFLQVKILIKLFKYKENTINNHKLTRKNRG